MLRFLYLTLFIISYVAPSAAYAQIIGTVTSLEGAVIKLEADKQSTLAQGSDVSLNDTILTQSESSIIITFLDNTILALGAETQLTIDEYVYSEDNAKANKAEFTVLKGPFHYISGLIAKKEKPDVTLKLDFGSIGIRGTKIWRDMTMTDEGKPQCRIYVEDGRARVSNGKGFTTLGDGDGTRIIGLTTPPTTAKAWGEDAIADIKSKSPAIILPEPAADTTVEPELEENLDTEEIPKPSATPADNQEQGGGQEEPSEQ